MLVLSRKKNESIVIDERIVITVVEIRGDKVRLGIEAPREVAIHRSEIFEALRRSQTNSMESANSVEPATSLESSEKPSEVSAGDEP